MTSKEALSEIYHCYNVNASDYDYQHGQIDCTEYFNKVSDDLEVLEILRHYIKGYTTTTDEHDDILTLDLDEITADEFLKVKQWVESEDKYYGR